MDRYFDGPLLKIHDQTKVIIFSSAGQGNGDGLCEDNTDIEIL